MPVLTVTVTPVDSVARKFFSDFRSRTRSFHTVKNPFTVHFKRFEELYLISIKHFWPPVYLFALIPAVVGLVFSLKWVFFPGVFLLTLGFFWSEWFFFLLLYAALRKAGYKGSVRLIGPRKALRVVVGGTG